MAAYTGTPRTWAAAEKVTAALLNAELRDPLAALSGAWTSYTPTVGGFTQGDGTVTGAYMRVSKLIAFRASFTCGSTSAAGSSLSLTLPVTAVNSSHAGPVNGWFVDSGTNVYMAAPAWNASYVALWVVGTNGAWVAPSATVPFTWTTGDIAYVAGVYEAA